MKNYIILLVGVAMLTSCADYQPKTQFGRNAKAWWNKPATQQGVQYIEQAALSFAVNAGMAAIEQYAGTGELDLGKADTYKAIALKGGIATLYSQASNIRQLQGTAQVVDPVATAQLLEQGGTSEEISRKLAAELFLNASALIQRGISPDQAAEVNAAGLDKAASKIAVIVEASK
jgi:hypothetical protein